MHKICKRFLALALLACFPLVFSACGGGGGSVEMTSISGKAVKGPIKGALVHVSQLNSDGTAGALLGSGTTGSDGAYSIHIPKAKAVAPLLVTVAGKAGAMYTSETTGNDVNFAPAETFNAVLDTFQTGKNYTVSPLTEAAYQQLQKFLTDSLAAKQPATADARIVSAANARIAALFNVSDILADPATDPAYAAALTIIDQMVVTSATGSTLQTMNLINLAFADVTSQAYQEYRTALTAAATLVVQNNPALATTVNALLAAAANPPAAPDWTDTTAPEAVTNLRAVAAAETTTTSSVTLYWSAATTTGKNPVAGYEIYRDGVKIASVAATSYVDKPLALTTTYKYYVVAFDAAGNRSVASAEVTATTPAAPNLTITVGGQLSSDVTSLPFKDIIAPSVPANLTASTTAITATTSSVKLVWAAATDNIGVTGYDVYRDGTKLGSTPDTTYTDGSVKSGTTYNYTVIAYDATGNRSAASVALAVTPVVPDLSITIGGQLSSIIGL